MKNAKIAEILYEIADILELKNVEFKPRAYRRAAQAIESMSEDIEKVHKQGKLEDVPGVGKSIAKKIEEMLKTGKLKYLERLRKQAPIDVRSLTAIEGLGAKKVKYLYKKLGIKSLKDLSKAVKAHKIKKLKGMREKTEESIRRGLEFIKTTGKRQPIGYIVPTVDEIINEMRSIKAVKKIDAVGSIRRVRETVRDIDLLIISDKPKEVIEFFTTKLKDVKRVLSKGPKRASIVLDSGLHVDIRLFAKESYGSALQYFTGNKAHNIALRKLAISRGYKLNEYGLFKRRKLMASRTEKEIYRALGLQYIPPEMRQNTGEIELAQKKKIPKLVELKDIKGDLQIHTKQSDGTETLESMAKALKSRYNYAAITDHTGTLKIAHGLTGRQLLAQKKKIKNLGKNLRGFTLLSGAEVNIAKDGTLDIPDKYLRELDVVVAAIHSNFKQSPKQITNRLMKAMENKHVDIIAHPTGVLLGKREGMNMDFDNVCETARATRTALEINCFPTRMDLDTSHIRTALEHKVFLVISTDSHNSDHLRYMELGAGLARRGWCAKKHIINTFPLNRLKKWLRS